MSPQRHCNYAPECPRTFGRGADTAIGAAMTSSTPVDTVLWTLTKDGALAKAVIREVSGPDADSYLRIVLLDDRVYEMRGCPPGPRSELTSVALRKRDELIGRGWVDASGKWPKVEPGD